MEQVLRNGCMVASTGILKIRRTPTATSLVDEEGKFHMKEFQLDFWRLMPRHSSIYNKTIMKHLNRN